MVKTQKHKKIIKWLMVVCSLFLFLSVLPYFIPITSGANYDPGKPFPESHFFEVDGIDLHYRLWLPAHEKIQGRVLLIHGMGGSTFSWRYTVESLTEAGYVVAAVDLPAFGYSSRKGGLKHTQVNRSLWLWRLLDEIGETLPTEIQGTTWHLVGHSMGGGVAAAMVVAQPNRTASAVFVDGALTLTSRNSRSILAYPPVRRWIQVALRHYIFKVPRIEKMLEGAYNRQPSAEEVQGYLSPLRFPGTERVFYDLIKSQSAVPLEPLRQIPVPMMAIWGREDQWIFLAQGEQFIKEVPSVPLYVIDGAGHCPMETHSEEFNAVLLDFYHEIS